MNCAARSVPVILANTFLLGNQRNQSVAQIPGASDDEESETFFPLASEIFLFSNLRIRISELKQQKIRLNKLVHLENENIENLTILQNNFVLLKERTVQVCQ